MPGTIETRREGSIGWIVINQPARRNAFTQAMWQAFGGALAEFDADEAVRTIVLRGEGRLAFSAGADISEFEAVRSTPEKAANYNSITEGSISRLRACAKPTVAMIYGFAVGGGIEMACSADFRFAAENARFGVPAAKLGISLAIVDVLPMYRLLGPANTKRILFTGGLFSAAAALQMGLVDEVAPEAELEDRVRALADQIASVSASSVSWSKHLVRLLDEDPRVEQLTAELKERELAFFGAGDYQQGVSAFLNKQPAQFSGR